MNTVQHVIIKPVITEKSLKDAQIGFFTFKVSQTAHKREIARAIEKVFSVNVTGVSTNIVKGTRVRLTKRGRSTQDLSYKKARVKLANGQKINIFDEKTK